MWYGSHYYEHLARAKQLNTSFLNSKNILGIKQYSNSCFLFPENIDNIGHVICGIRQ